MVTQQQHTTDSIMQSWQHSQHVNDDIFQRGSGAMLGNERLYDESLGKEYVAAAGSNYYWVDPTSGTVIGTDTETPPDYTRDYRLLKKRYGEASIINVRVESAPLYWRICPRTVDRR